MNTTDPIRHFYNETGFDRSQIDDLIIGDKYVALMNRQGNIGVCATLNTRVDQSILNARSPDLSNPSHRIILNAWFNSIHNYRREYTEIVDIFDRIDFSLHNNIVMVGYFESLYEKFTARNINLSVYDIAKKSSNLDDIESMEDSLHNAEAVILTGTTVFNGTFTSVIGKTGDNTDIFLLGPSNILSEQMFEYRNIKVVFGSVFERGDSRVLDKIAQGSGTRGFLQYLKKVYIKSDSIKYDF